MTNTAMERELCYETMMTDPLIRLVMASDGVTPQQLRAVLDEAGRAVAARDPAGRM